MRADITPQAARIDAHLLNRKGVTRLCYSGPVVHTLPSGVGGTRELLQIGAEIYGHGGLQSDVEILRLMLQSMAEAGIQRVQLDLGHMGVFRALAAMADFGAEAEPELFRALQAKDVPALEALAAGLDGEVRAGLLALPELYGGPEALAEARRRLPRDDRISRALDDLERLAEAVRPLVSDASLDLCEVRGYHYHSGVVFAAYAPGSARALAIGGRYDEVGKAFGRARPATGFSADLRVLAQLSGPGQEPSAVRAPPGEDPALAEKIRALRAAGEVVVVELPGHEDACGEDGCDRELVLRGGKWEVVSLRP